MIKKEKIKLSIFSSFYSDIHDKVFSYENKCINGTFIYKIISILNISDGKFVKNSFDGLQHFIVHVLAKTISLENGKTIYAKVERVIPRKGYILSNGPCKIELRDPEPKDTLVDCILKCKIQDYLLTDNLNYIKVKCVL